MIGQHFRVFAIVPAAGLSSRMGTSKLLLPWPTDKNPAWCVIDSVLDAWVSSCVDHVVVVLRPDDDALYNACSKWPVQIVQPTTPLADMKASLQCGLHRLNDLYQPASTDRCFMAPADLPSLTSHIIDRLYGASDDTRSLEKIIVPRFGDHLGHPVLFPWTTAWETHALGDDQGVNVIVGNHAKFEVAFLAENRLRDMDTPIEYRRALRDRSN